MEQSESNKIFRGQVEWELDAQERADVVLLYFDPTTKSPISLLELGLFHKKMMVCCPDGFWRKGNVDIVCERYRVPIFETLKDLRLAVARKVLELRHGKKLTPEQKSEIKKHYGMVREDSMDLPHEVS